MLPLGIQQLALSSPGEQQQAYDVLQLRIAGFLNLLAQTPRLGGRQEDLSRIVETAPRDVTDGIGDIHKADEAAVKDMIVEITGLRKTDQIVRLMYASFDAVRSFITGEVSASEVGGQETVTDALPMQDNSSNAQVNVGSRLGLSYQINIILPETENVAVFNAIFKSLRENLLR